MLVRLIIEMILLEFLVALKEVVRDKMALRNKVYLTEIYFCIHIVLTIVCRI